MKAKDCAEIYLNADDKQNAIAEICFKFLMDTKAMIESRKISEKSHPTIFIAVLREQEMKWKSFARQTNGEIKENGFRLLCENQLPEIAPFFN